MTATASLPGLFNALNQCREPDWVLLGVIADALEELCDWRAEGYRWAVERRRWCGSFETGPYFWMLASKQGIDAQAPWLTWELCRHWTNNGDYDTITAAFRDLASMLRKAEAGGVDTSKL